MFDNNEFDLSSLNLAGVTAASSSGVLPVGRYVCTTKGAKVEKNKATAKDPNGLQVTVLCVDTAGKGVITARITIRNKSAEAVRIGKEQLKGLCVHGGHPDPDNPFADNTPSSLNGLTVGVVVGPDSYNGEAKSKVNGFCDPKTVKGYEDSQAGAIGGDADIPF